MDESPSSSAAASASSHAPPPPEAPAAVEDEEVEQRESNGEDEALVTNVQTLMDKITSNPDNPNPKVLHALASILETHEARYMEDAGHSALNNTRASHSVGRLGNLVRENDEFFELISSKFLSENRYAPSTRAAAVRLLFSCSLTWMYPHVFEDAVLGNIKGWVIDEIGRPLGEHQALRHDIGKMESSDLEMLTTYSTGLLAVCLASGGQVVEDVLTSGLSAKLMRYLRVRVLGETNQKDVNHLTESKSASVGTSMRSKEEVRGRSSQILDISLTDAPRSSEGGSLDDQVADRDRDRSLSKKARVDELRADGELPTSLRDDVDIHELDADCEDIKHTRDLRDGRVKFGDKTNQGKSVRDEGLDDSNKDEPSRRRANRGLARSRGKGRANEGNMENDQALTSPISGNRVGVQVSSIKDRGLSRNPDPKRIFDTKKNILEKTVVDCCAMERDESDDCFKECNIGSKDISNLVKKAVRSAEAEARAANAPVEAIKAAGDAAAEVVKSAALDEYEKTKDEEAAVLAASKAASTVVDAAKAVELSRHMVNCDVEPTKSFAAETEANEEAEEFFVLDIDSLAKLREKFCIQCLVILGEYVEVLGPMLHEKGVDVCLALLNRSLKHEDASKVTALLPDVLKLISALAAHRKFAALFVDRGGMQKLLAVARVAQTFFGLSSCLFTIGSIQGIMERICALPLDVVHQLVELALQLFECPQDQARKNAALFFAAAFVFRAILDSFDAQDGLQKLLNLLSDAASVRNNRSPAEVLTSSGKQIAYHTCVALRQYFRAHLLLLVDSIRPNKNNRGTARNIPSVRAPNKPLDISNEAMDAILCQIQKDRKLGPAFVRARWPAVDKFISFNGHVVMLELCQGLQATPVERYLHDLVQYALGVLHIVSLVPYSRRLIVNATLSNDRVGIAVILDASNGAGYVDPEIIQPALHILVNLVCPPPSISNKPPLFSQNQQSGFGQTSNAPTMEQRDRNAERNVSSQSELRDRNGESNLVDKSSATASGASFIGSSSQTPTPTVGGGLVGDRRISLGAGAGCAGLAAQLEQGYRQAREAVRANNGIKVLLQLLQPRLFTPPSALDCLRALACRVLLGLARDDAIAHILTKLQVGKKLSELIRDAGGQTPSSDQGRWPAELAQAAIELIGIVTNSGRASTLAATDAATPTLRRIERAAIAAATPITYHSRELLLLIHEHLQATGLAAAAAALLKEAQLTPLPSLVSPSSLVHQGIGLEAPSIPFQWPSGRTTHGFFPCTSKLISRGKNSSFKSDSVLLSTKKKPFTISTPNSNLKSEFRLLDPHLSSSSKMSSSLKRSTAPAGTPEAPPVSVSKPSADAETQFRTPILLPMKRKFTDSKEIGPLSSVKRANTGEHGPRSPVCLTPNSLRRGFLAMDANQFCSPTPFSKENSLRSVANSLCENLNDGQCSTPHISQVTPSHHGHVNDLQPSNSERLTLDSLVVQYLKHQHRQCPAPITTLPPLSLLHPHVCPEPKRSLYAPLNVTARLSTREFRSIYKGIHGRCRDRQFVYSRFRPWRTCRDDGAALLTCLAFLGDSSRVIVGSHSGELKIFDSNSNNVLESYTGHQSPVTLVQSYLAGDTQLVLSSSARDVRLWDAASLSTGSRHAFDDCKAARFSNAGTTFAALSLELSQREILLYDVHSCQLALKFTDSSTSPTSRGHIYSFVHFSPSDTMLLWNGVLWDRRISGPVHRFDQFSDYGGGGFHPAGNEVIINSEVWDLRNFRLLRSVPSLDQTIITFNASGDVIYATLRRNFEEITSALQSRRMKHPLFTAFRTVDAVNYTDIATIPVDRCVLDFTTEPTDSFVGLVTLDDQDEMYSSARLYEIGRRRPTDDDSDPDDAESEEDDEEDDDDIDEDPMGGHDFEVDDESDADDMSDDDSGSELDDDDDDEEDGDYIMDDVVNGGGGILEILTEDEGDGDSEIVESLSSGEEDDYVFGP